MNETIEKYDFKYETTPHTIDINTLLLSQLHFVSAITEIQKNLYPEYEFKIKVDAPKDGSFVFQQLYELTQNNNLFSKDTVDYASNAGQVIGSLFSGLFGLYKIAKHLKGKKAVAEKDNGNGTVDITNEQGQTVSFDKNIFNLHQKQSNH